MRNFLLVLVVGLLFKSTLLAQTTVELNMVSMKKTEDNLDSLNIILRNIALLTRSSLSIANSSNELYKKNILLAEELYEITQNNANFSEQLVILTKSNKESAELLKELTKNLVVLGEENKKSSSRMMLLSIFMGVFAFIQVVYIINLLVQNSRSNQNED